MAKTAKGKSTSDNSVATGNQPDSSSNARPTDEEIAVRAYHIYLERAGADGDALDDWLQAERELTEAKS